MEIAKQGIEKLETFLFDTLKLQRTLTEVGIKPEDFPIMARKACRGKILKGFKPLNQQDIENIFQMCL
jgi:alcohol dehydrogenase YqhD (iron-dependent ADH family)